MRDKITCKILKRLAERRELIEFDSLFKDRLMSEYHEKSL